MELLDKIFCISNEREFGFFNKDNLIKFYIPEQLINTKKEENFIYLKKYNAILRKYTKNNLNKVTYNNNLSKDIQADDLEVINSYLNLIDDYLSNGAFNLFERFYKKGDKKINWNKTLKENNIIISREGEIIYNSFYSKNTQNNTYHQFYLLYTEALRRSHLYLLGINHTEEQYYPKNINEQKYHLNKYSEEHFKDRELFIAENLKNIYLKEKWSNINEANFEFKYHLKFEYIWQDMISNITNNYNNHINITKGTYLKTNSVGIHLLQDHFIKIDKNYYLFDSKFYKTYDTKIYPDTAEISKQFMYKYLISKQKKIDIEDIANFFIFPKNNENKEPELFNIHYNEEFPELTIFCIALDVQTVIDFYLNDNNYEKLHQLFISINKENLDLINQFKNQNTYLKKQIINNKYCYVYKSKKGNNNAIIYLEIDTKGFHIIKGSTGYLSTDKEILVIQKELIDKNIIGYKDKSMIIFLEDYIFDSKEEGYKIINGQVINLNWTQNKTKIKKSKI